MAIYVTVILDDLAGHTKLLQQFIHTNKLFTRQIKNVPYFLRTPMDKFKVVLEIVVFSQAEQNKNTNRIMMLV